MSAKMDQAVCFHQNCPGTITRTGSCINCQSPFCAGYEFKCLICKRVLNDPADPIASRDCGGDCLRCMAEIGGDPDCIKELERA